MKKILTFILVMTCLLSFSQEKFTLKTMYKIANKYGENTILRQTKKIDTIFRIGDTIMEKIKVTKTGVEVEKFRTIILDSAVTHQSNSIEKCNDCPSIAKAFIKLKEDKIYVNYYLAPNIDKNGTYYFKLNNRDTFIMYHNGGTVSALVIPIKYRFPFKKNGEDVSEEFSVDFNANLFLSWTFRGKTRLTYFQNLDNSIRDQSWRIGAFLGGSGLKLNKANTSTAGENRLENEITKGLISTGLGITYNFNTISFGGFFGYDFAVGKNSDIWDYDGKPWLGISVGIDLFKFGKIDN